MTKYVLDTDILTLFQRGDENVVAHVLSHPIHELAISVITVEEELTGWYTKLRQVRKREQLAQVYQRLSEAVLFFGRFRILSFTEPAIARYEELRKSKLNVAKNDLRIAAIALENGTTVSTRNVRDFQRVPGLTVEDWSKQKS